MKKGKALLKSLLRALITLTIIFSVGFSSPAVLYADGPSQADAVPLSNPKYQSLIKELSEKYKFKTSDLKALFKQVVFQKEIIAKFERPAEHLPFHRYRKIFIKEDMVRRGREYLAKNDKLLTEVEEAYGVEKEIIASILGVETRFGKPGIEKYRAFDILNTAYFLYPRREKFYRQELIAFLRLCREEGLDPFSIKSSYAGAFGVPQFIPSSFLKYAVDFDHDGKRDLWKSKRDIFASVANYLKKFGWKRGQLTYLPSRIQVDSAEVQKLLKRGYRKTVSVAKAMKIGVDIPPPAKGDDLVSFAFYEPRAGEKSLLALFGNFRTITRYNTSVHYALVIVHLSRRLVMRDLS